MSVKRVGWHLAKFLPAGKEGFWALQVNMVDKPTQRNGFSSSAPPPGFVLLDFGFCDTEYFFLPCGSLLGGLFQISLSLSRGKYQKLMEPWGLLCWALGCRWHLPPTFWSLTHPTSKCPAERTGSHFLIPVTKAPSFSCRSLQRMCEGQKASTPWDWGTPKLPILREPVRKRLWSEMAHDPGMALPYSRSLCVLCYTQVTNPEYFLQSGSSRGLIGQPVSTEFPVSNPAVWYGKGVLCDAYASVKIIPREIPELGKDILESLSPAEGQLGQKFSVQGHSQADSTADPFLLLCVNRLGRRPPNGDLNVFIRN